MRSTAPYPPGHARRTRLRRLLQDLGATSVGLTFESCRGRFLLLSYRTEPARHRLAGHDRAHRGDAACGRAADIIADAPEYDVSRSTDPDPSHANQDFFVNTPTPGNTVPTALRQLLAGTLLALRDTMSSLRGPLACLVLAGAWGAFLVLTGSAEALGRMVPWPVSLVLLTTLFVILFVGGSVRRPDSFPHEVAWKRARAVFLTAGTIAVATCYLTFLFS